MALVEWKETYAVHISEIDDQHKNLVELVNRLHDALKQGKAKEILGDVLDELVKYTLYHFETEEKYFDMYDYPDSEIHKQQHKDLVEQVSAVVEKFNSGERILTIEVMNFLRDWLNDHILESDTKFGPYLKSRGLN